VCVCKYVGVWEGRKEMEGRQNKRKQMKEGKE
jgi:hypothetical protein